jgi:hypothetical protein
VNTVRKRTSSSIDGGFTKGWIVRNGIIALRDQEEDMGTLIFVCPASGIEVATGIEMEIATLECLEFSKVYCPHCRQTHQMAGMEYWLTELGEPEPSDDNEEVKAA